MPCRRLPFFLLPTPQRESEDVMDKLKVVFEQTCCTCASFTVAPGLELPDVLYITLLGCCLHVKAGLEAKYLPTKLSTDRNYLENRQKISQAMVSGVLDAFCP